MESAGVDRTAVFNQCVRDGLVLGAIIGAERLTLPVSIPRIETKLHVPASRRALVPRPRLLDRLEQ